MKVASKEIHIKSGKALTLRSPHNADAKILLKFLKTLFRESWQNLNGGPKRFENLTEEELAQTLATFEVAQKDFFLCAFLDGEIIGNLSFHGNKTLGSEHCASLGIGVDKEYHGQGIAKGLMEYALDVAKKNGLWNIQFHVRTHNQSGIGLYESLGFRRVGILFKASKVGEDYQDEYLYQRLL